MTAVTELTALPPLELAFPAGLPGLRQLRRMRLEALGTSSNVFGRLLALDELELGGSSLARLGFVVAAPGLLWPDYAVEIDDEHAELLELSDPADAAALVVVNVAERIEDCTANLFAPIVLNLARALAAQVVPGHPESEHGWSLRTPLPLLSAA